MLESNSLKNVLLLLLLLLRLLLLLLLLLFESFSLLLADLTILRCSYIIMIRNCNHMKIFQGKHVGLSGILSKREPILQSYLTSLVCSDNLSPVVGFA